MRGQPFRDDQHREVAQLTRVGWTAAEIAGYLGVHTKTVERSRSCGGKVGPAPRLFSADEILRIEAMLEDGCSYTEIGRTVGRAARTISGHWPNRGWDMHEAGEFRRFTHKLEAMIIEAWPTLARSR